MIKTKTMSPLIIVGILISTALADVSHVLSGAAHPPANPVDINSLSAPKNAFQSGNPNDFWWMASNSPLKEAYDYFKKCSSKGDCLPPESIVPGVKVAEAHFDPIDLKKNPFLNGEFLAGALSSSSSSSSSGCTTCSEGSKPGEVAAFHTGTKIDILKNPFLNGQFATAGNGEKVRNEDGFLGVQPKKPEFATSHPLSNKKPFATFPPNVPQSQQSFVLGGGNIEEQECKGQGYICVSKDLCINGVINKTEDIIPVNNNIQYCNLNTEICCRLTDGPLSIVLSNSDGKNSLASTINNLADITAGKSSVTGSSFKFSGGAGSSPGQIQVLIDGSDDIKPQVYHNSESGSHSSASTNKATRDVTLSANSVFPSTVDYSGVQISNDIRFGSTIQGPAYLPPIGGPIPPSGTPELIAPTQPSIITYQPTVATTPRPVQTTRFVCPPGTFLTSFGICESSSTPAPSCPLGTFRTPDGNCERPIVSTTPRSCPPGTILTAFGSCETPTTPAPRCPFGTFLTPDGSCARSSPPPSPSPSPRPCPPGTFFTASGLCEAPRTPSPSCPFGTVRRPDGICERPSPPLSPISCPAGTFLTASGTCEGPSPPAPSCPFGFIQTPDGTCISPGTPTTPIPCPPGTILTSSGICESLVTPSTRLPCPPGTIQSVSGVCQSVVSTTIGYEYQTPCPPGTFQTSTGLCQKIELSTVTPQCPIGTYLTPTGNCEAPRIPTTPKPPPRPFETTVSRDYLVPVIPTQPSASSFTGYYYETPTPTFSYPSSTLIPNSNIINNQYVLPPTTSRPIIIPTGTSYLPPVTTPQYLPPATDKITGGSSIKNEFLPPRRTTSRPIIIPTGTSYLSPVTTPQYLPPATTPQYLPPATDKITGGSSIKNEFLPPRRTTTERPGIDTTGANNNEYIVTIPSTRRPPPFNPEQNNEPPVGCAAALKCVQEIYCTAEGVVSPVPVVLTKDQELLRVPTTVCKDEDSGIIGKCCRDPNYKDPWPSANLVNGVDDGQYKEDNLYGQRELLSTNRLTRSSNVTRSEITQTLQSSQEICGQRHKNTKPPGPGHIDANFSEYPWQAMILRDSNRSLLCGGAIIRRNAVLTAAHCVEGLDTSDVLIKGGEWKLGIDEEPLPFQIVKVGAILRHPEYVPGSYKNDLAVLILREKLRPSKNVGTICLSEANQLPTVNCVATGWGKRILQLHAKGAIMHHINVKVIDAQQCQQTLSQSFQASIENYSPNTLCGVSDIDQCKVDYGSALACSNDQGQYTLTGIYAWDTGCKEENQIGGYIAPDVEWIESILSKPIKELKKIEREYLLKTTN